MHSDKRVSFPRHHSVRREHDGITNCLNEVSSSPHSRVDYGHPIIGKTFWNCQWGKLNGNKWPKRFPSFQSCYRVNEIITGKCCAGSDSFISTQSFSSKLTEQQSNSISDARSDLLHRLLRWSFVHGNRRMLTGTIQRCASGASVLLARISQATKWTHVSRKSSTQRSLEAPAERQQKSPIAPHNSIRRSINPRKDHRVCVCDQCEECSEQYRSVCDHADFILCSLLTLVAVLIGISDASCKTSECRSWRLGLHPHFQFVISTDPDTCRRLLPIV